jgi:AcrR family transcriptional regulator
MVVRATSQRVDDGATRPPDPDTLPTAQRARRDRIVQAAIDLLADADYESVQMRDVAEHAGVALGTLYRYFSSKEHLYAAANLAWASSYGPPRRVADTDTAAGGTADEAHLRALMRRALRAFEKSPQMLRAQMVVEQSADPNARELYDRFTEQNAAVTTSALQHLSPAHAEAVMMTVNCVMANRLRSWAHGRCTMREVERAVQQTIDLVFGPPPPTT